MLKKKKNKQGRNGPNWGYQSISRYRYECKIITGLVKNTGLIWEREREAIRVGLQVIYLEIEI